MNFINGIKDLVLYFFAVIYKFDFFVYLIMACLFLVFLVRIFKKFTHI